MRMFLFISMLGASCALAQSPAAPSQDGAPATETILIDDREATLRPADEPLPEKILEPPPPEAAPTVSIRTDGNGDVVEEYRQNGRVYLVKVRPLKGRPYSLLDTNGDGRLDETDFEGTVRPVFWTLYEWN